MYQEEETEAHDQTNEEIQEDFIATPPEEDLGDETNSEKYYEED